MVCGWFAWRVYRDGGPEQAFLRATAAAILMAIGCYTVAVPTLAPAFPAVARSDLALALNRASALADLRRLAQGQMPPPALVSAYSGVTASLLAFDSEANLLIWPASRM